MVGLRCPCFGAEGARKVTGDARQPWC
jgi:hypothetical protein